ncbi:putative RTX-family protein [Yersinia aldovae]|uniref:hypothetical protein n=1 Tax=Yersinia aldovae TaxID=29483 RepID=UPI0005E114D5|nr:hypothetical protein [Yersinia aldovae]CNI09143.1 putative RTX-family protein [Yersinia aldovae]
MSSENNYSFEFSHGRDVIGKLSSSLYEIGFYSVTPGDEKASKRFSDGLCYGMSAKFMIEERNHGAGGGKKYFAWLQNAVDGYTENARIVDREPNNIQKKLLIQYHRQFLYTELETIQKLQYSQNINSNYKIINEDLNSVVRFLKSSEYNKSLVDVYAFAQEINEKSVAGRISNHDIIDTIEKYIDNKDNNFKNILNEARENGNNKKYLIGYISDNLVENYNKMKRDHVKDGSVTLDKKDISPDMFGEMLGAAIESERTRSANNYGGYLLERGLIRSDPRDEKTRRVETKNNRIARNDKFNNIINRLSNVSHNKYISIMSPNHAMAISIIQGSNTRWTFFDPRYGGRVYDNYEDFKQGVYEHLRKIEIVKGSKRVVGIAYDLPEDGLKNMDFSINYIEYEDDNKPHQNYKVWKKAQDGEQAYIVKSLKENNIIFNLPLKSTAKVIDYSLIQKETGEWLVKNLVVEVTAEGKTFNVHQSVESFDSAVKNLRANIDILINYKNDNPSITDIDLTNGVVKKSPTNFTPEISKAKTYNEITVYKPELESLSSRTKNVIDILDRLAEKRVSLADLSSNSKKSLAEFFNLSQDILNSRDILRIITDSDFYLQTRLELSELQQVSANNSQLEKLTAGEALEISKQHYADKAERYLKSVNLTGQLKTKPTEMVNQILTLSIDSASGQKKQLDLGAAYLYASSKGDLTQFKQQLAKHLELCYLNAQGTISDNERKQLDNFNEKFTALSELQYKDIRHLRTDGNLSSILELDVGYYQLMVDDAVLNITVERTEEKHSYSIYDTEGGESNFYGIDKSEVSRKALSFIEGYVVSNTKTQSAQNYKLYSFDLSDGAIDGSGLRIKEFYQQKLITERQRLVELGNTFFNQQKIAFSTLYDMGAVLDGKLLTADVVTNNPDWQTNLRFDPFLINEFYTLPDQTSVEQQQSVKVMKTLLESKNNNKDLLNYHSDPKVIQDAGRYLAAINISVSSDGNTRQKLWNRLTQVSAQSSRFQSFGQKVGTATQSLALFTLSTSTYGMIKRLLDPNIKDKEKSEIMKQLAISWSSFGIDVGTDTMSLKFDKLHRYFSKKLLSRSTAGISRIGYKMAAKTAKYAGAGLNLFSAGFDIYEAYENFSKANSEGNVDLIIDYKVNGSLAVIGAAVSIITAVALALGLSAAGPIGIAIGAGIMVGGMIYNAVRQVEYIKNKIELTGLDTFSTGARLFLGMEPSQEIQERLMAKVLNESIPESANYMFKHRSHLMGADNLVFSVEKYDGAREIMYTFVYKIDNEYVKAYRDGDEYEDLVNRNNNRAAESGTDRLDVILKYKRWTEVYSDVDISDDLSDSEINNRISKNFTRGDLDRYNVMRYQRSPLTKYEVDQWKKTVNVDDYDILEIETTNINKRYTEDNIIVKNVELLDSHLQLAKMRAAVTLDFKSSIIEIKANGNNESILYEKEYNFGKSSTVTTTPENNNGNVHYFLGGGNNFVIAENDVSNTYETGGGIDLFIGGSKSDQVILTDATGTLALRFPGIPHGYFDGQGGSDTIYLDKGRFVDQDYRIDLQEGYVNNRNGNVLVAKLANIENVVSQSAGKHVISGNHDDNFLSHINGSAFLYGREGNDILTLSHGSAYGGEGIDTYAITTDFRSDKSVNIGDSGIDEISNIMVDYNINEIKSIKLFRNEVHVTMVRNGFKQMLYLRDAYKSDEADNNKKLNHNYIISTADGFILTPNWPTELSRDQVELSSSLEMVASYNYLTDKKLYKEGAVPIAPKKIIICKEADGYDSMIIDDEIIILPNFIKCSTTGINSIRSVIFGSNESEIFSNLGGGACIDLNGGRDVIKIPRILRDSLGDNIRINCNSGRVLEQEDTLTLIFDDVSGYDLQTKNLVDGSIPLIEISHKTSNINSLDINIYTPSFLSSNDGNPLITLIDKNKTVFYIEDKGTGYEIIEALPTNINVTEGNDNIIIPLDYHLPNKRLDTGNGDDIIYDSSGRDHTLDGGSGNDIISVTSGSNWLMGGVGNDELYAGQGNDRLSGGDGDDLLCSSGGNIILEGDDGNDTYIIKRADGITKIVDSHGANEVIFKDSKLDQWVSSREGNTLIFARKGSQQEVRIYGYYSRDEILSEQMFSFRSSISPTITGDLHLLGSSMAILSEESADNSQLAMSVVSNIPAVQQPPTFLPSQSPFIVA